MTALVAAVAAGGLIALLATAFRSPAPAREASVSAGVAVVVAGPALASGVLGIDGLATEIERLLPVTAFLVAVLVVAAVCSRAGVFTLAGGLVARWSGGGPVQLVTGVFALATVVTTVLGLDATAVLLTPVVLGAAAAAHTSARPGAWACLRMANSASLLLPVSNLTNLLALPRLDLSAAGFAARMAPVLAAVLVVEYVALRLLWRRELAAAAAPPAPVTPAPGPPAPADRRTSVRAPLVVVALMITGVLALSPLGVDPAWPTVAAAAVLAGWARHRGLLGTAGLLRAAHPSFAAYVLALGVTVAALGAAGLGDLVRDLLSPLASPATGVGDLLLLAALATVASGLLTNLSAALLLLPVVAPLGTDAVLATLLGLDVGAGLVFTGSLATLLWHRSVRGSPAEVGQVRLHLLSLATTPVALVAGVAALALT